MLCIRREHEKELPGAAFFLIENGIVIRDHDPGVAGLEREGVSGAIEKLDGSIVAGHFPLPFEHLPIAVKNGALALDVLHDLDLVFAGRVFDVMREQDDDVIEVQLLSRSHGQPEGSF